MNKVLSAISTVFAVMLAASAWSVTPVMDGTRDAEYGAPYAVQTSNTGFGNSSGGLAAGGSELDAIYIQNDTTHLYVFLSGNLENNGNIHGLYIDVLDNTSGSNPVPQAPGGVGGIGEQPFNNGMSNITFPAAMTSVEYGFAVKSFGASPRGWSVFYADYSTTPAVSSFSTNQTTTAMGSANVGSISGGAYDGFGFAINNDNAAGVDGTGNMASQLPASGGDPAAVTTGVELAIPLAMIGNPTDGDQIRIVAAHISGDGNFWSNQTLPGLTNPAGLFVAMTNEGGHIGGGAHDLSTGAKAINGSVLYQLGTPASVGSWDLY